MKLICCQTKARILDETSYYSHHALVSKSVSQFQKCFATAFLKSKKPSRLAYQKLVETKCIHKISSQDKWIKVFPEARELNWHDAYMNAIKCTKSTKLIEFQFRFLHQTLATNTTLVKMGYKDDTRCTFCHEESETSHIFFGFVEK